MDIDIDALLKRDCEIYLKTFGVPFPKEDLEKMRTTYVFFFGKVDEIQVIEGGKKDEK